MAESGEAEAERDAVLIRPDDIEHVRSVPGGIEVILRGAYGDDGRRETFQLDFDDDAAEQLVRRVAQVYAEKVRAA